ncbi:hypothetical protein PMG11_06825 [Penicillium brasilianum]|uniref:Uncharacterized protein n=1 Tax=Penicillium brasilianum TaxID=104259 RepID=A0A0F7TRV1_PENBI|nr:hypothetical protein PMG11_06825 [Penicillium brasilianum]
MTSEEVDIDPDQLLELFEVLKTNDPQKKRAFPDVFYTSGHWSGRVRPKYFNLALMANFNSVRYVSDEVLDELIPEWRKYMNGKSFPSNAKAHEATFRAWCIRERMQYEANGVPFPQPLPTSTSNNRRATTTAAPPSARTSQGGTRPSITMGQQSQAMNVRSMNAQVMSVTAMNPPVRTLPAMNPTPMNPSARTLPPMITPIMNLSATNPSARNPAAMTAPAINPSATNPQDLQAVALRLEQLGRNTHQYANQLREYGQRELRVAQLLLEASCIRR